MFKRISIFTKLTVAISFCLAFFLLILGMIIIDLQENSLIEEKKRNAEKITLLFSKMSSFHIEKYSYFMLDENTTYLQAKVDNERDILSVIVKDANGRKLNPSGISEDKIDIPTKYRLKIEKMCKGSNGDIIGKVEIIFSLESIYRKILNIRLIYISIVLSTILILNILLGILIYFIINKPLKNLTVAVERFNSNNFDVSLKSQSNDEIGFLSKTFLDMALNLKNSFLEIERQNKEIENYNKNLELLVQERTHELEKSNNELLKINERIKAELQIAQKIQLAIIPKVLPVSDFINLSGKYMPMTDLGGD
ncbi:MAG TPA: HAMP domain-containing protein, partial [Spirochaetota bacterium]|nr:HAMP domain-containing protein [Spirochaetota bacterium]